MKTILAVLPVLFLCGCLAPASLPDVSYWLMEYRDAPAPVKTPRYGIVRLSQVVVCAPYAGDRMVVLRGNGTVAFDALNVFAAPPPLLLRGVCFSALRASGLFAGVIEVSSGASAPVSAEVVVSRLALDCRQEDSRRALAGVLVRVLEGKKTVATVEGEGAADASDGDFGVAFSKAVSAAVSSALFKLR